MTLRELFDGALELGVDLTLYARQVPTAERELRAWASERGFAVDDRTRVVEDDHPMESWRGMWVSTVSVETDRVRICVHRSKPDEKERAA
jgi:hypothetical protein